jgi:hypothetical protein
MSYSAIHASPKVFVGYSLRGAGLKIADKWNAP